MRPFLSRLAFGDGARSPGREVLCLAAIGASALALGCEPLSDGFDFDREDAPIFARSEIVDPPSGAPSRLRVMAYNIKFGAARADFWFDYWGDVVELDDVTVAGNLANLHELIREVDPDVLITEEIDVHSKRSAYHDMVQETLEGTRLNYAAYIQTWDSRYIPSEGVGRMDMGNAIFSRYPIVSAERIRQPDRTDLDFLTATYYLHRMIGHAVLDLGGGRTAAVYAVHTEAYDKDGTKGRQIQQIYDVVKAETAPFLLGGDFNELPPNAVKLVGFPDESPKAKGTEYEQPPYTPEIMQKFYDDLTPWITLDQYGATEEAQRTYFTHSVVGPNGTDNEGNPGFWNRTLDYLFVSKASSWADGESDVLQVPGRQGITSNPLLLSDHAPVVGTWILEGSP